MQTNALDALLTQLQADPRFSRNVTAWRTLPSRPAQSSPWEPDLHPAVLAAARTLGIDAVYVHQRQAIQASRRGEDVVLATGTASGKTLGYIVPLLNTLANDPNATALLLFPTKALAHDQLTSLERWIQTMGLSIPLRSYDGDTPQRLRSEVRKEARIIISNPDMIHLGILPHHTRWMRFFRGLRYIVVDELHSYRGIFGSHVANVLRRLRRIAAFYGASPQFLAASATIGNPQQLAEALWEDSVTPVLDDGAPYGKRHVILYNPPLVNPELGLRSSVFDEALTLVIRLLRARVQSIVFARSRLSVELFLQSLRSRIVTLGFDSDVVQGYRGGYLPHERRTIEQDLRTGKTRVVVATNALELGIDIGALDASILLGYPGTIASTRQQMGRAGRRAGASMSVLLATPAPLDQYLITHPEYLFGNSPEHARVNPDTLSLLAAHLTCAAFELPFTPGETFGKSKITQEILTALAEEHVLHEQQGRFTWVSDSYPAQSVSLRTATPDNVVVQAEGMGAIGIVDRPSAAILVHEGAIYFHAAEAYLVESLDWDHGTAYARPIVPSYYTVATSATKVERLVLRKQIPENQERVPDILLSDEEVMVYTKPAMYRRVDMNTHEVLGWGEIHLPEQEMETESFRVTLGEKLVDALADHGVMVAPLDYGPEWPQIRKEVLDRDQHHCRLCGATGDIARTLEVHHLTPLRTYLAQYPRAAALKLAHSADNLITLCPICHHKVEQARGARTALGGLAYLIRNLAPVFLMCDPGDLGTAVEARDAYTGRPSVVVYDDISGGVGLSPNLLDFWPQLAQACLERVTGCQCERGCPSCVGPVGESEPGAKQAAKQLLELIV